MEKLKDIMKEMSVSDVAIVTAVVFYVGFIGYFLISEFI